MSTLKVNAIEPYSGGTVAISGSSVTISGYTPSNATSASYATVAENLTAGNKTINGTLDVTGVANFGDDVKLDVGVSGNGALLVNPNFFSTFYGETLLWQPNTNGGQSKVFIGEKALAELYVNAYSGSYDNMLKIGANGQGAFMAGINPVTFADDVWLRIPSMGEPDFQRTINVSGSVNIAETVKLAPQDPLPAGTVGDLAVSGSSLYFYNGAWTLVV